MSNIKSKNTEFSKIEFNENKINFLENKSKEKAKELIKTLLKNTLNASLLKLESNSNNHIESLKLSSKSFKEFSKLINNINIKIEETKKKKFKEREKKAQVFKKGRKIVTEYNFNNRSKTIESNLIKFRNKMINIDGKKNISKLNKKHNMIGHKLGNKTMLSFRNINEIENDENINQKIHRFKNISLQNTSQNFRKVNHKIIPATPVIKLRDKEKKQILAKAIKYKNVDYKNGKNAHSRTVILSHLADIEENNENIESNRKNYNQNEKYSNKNVKRIIYKNQNKNKDIRINYKTEKVNGIKNNLHNRNIHENLNKTSIIKSVDGINKDTNNNIIFNSTRNSNKNINIHETNELKNIVKLVDDVNENLNKLLKVNSNNNRKKSFVKELKFQNLSSKELISAIKDIKIKELQNNSLEITNNNFNKKDKDNEKINISKSYSLNFLQKKEYEINLKKNENNIIKLLKNMYINDDIMKEGQKKNQIKKNKSSLTLGYNCKLLEYNSDKKYYKSTENIFKGSKYYKIKEANNLLKEKMNIQKKSEFKYNNNENEKNEIINYIFEIIINKAKEKIQFINNQKILKNENINGFI